MGFEVDQKGCLPPAAHTADEELEVVHEDDNDDVHGGPRMPASADYTTKERITASNLVASLNRSSNFFVQRTRPVSSGNCLLCLCSRLEFIDRARSYLAVLTLLRMYVLGFSEVETPR